MKLKKGDKPGNVPNHVVIIPDGNRRWAQEHAVPLEEAYLRSVDRVKEALEICRDVGIRVFTFWALSTENWLRPPLDLKTVFDLAARVLSDQETLRDFNRQGGRFVHIGRKDRIPRELAEVISNLEAATSSNKEYIFNFAFDYGGRNEILRALAKMASASVDFSKITEDEFAKFLDTTDEMDPDLIIRTSGEMRTSGMYPWQACYAELYFTDIPFPAFTGEHFRRAIESYWMRNRRFGR